ncbi:MAG: hypothetical protein GWP08_11105 [Nitrospiraceae bacterium]|nr:hypothetical protein [Nitrospiraceae bacterium]
MMKKFLACLLILSVVVAIGACSKPDSDAGSPAAAQRSVPAPTGASTPATKPATDAAPMAAADLVGTVWSYDGMTITFKDDSNLLLKGGVVDGVAPEGLEGTYSLKDGIIEVNAMNITKTGTFDGKTMVVDGKPAVLMQ